MQPDETKTEKSMPQKSIDAGKEHAKALNTTADYRAANRFINKHAPAAAAKHMDLVLKNRKDNQQRK